jgi:hypothetical protein
MEQQPRGARSKITAHDEPVFYGRQMAGASPPLTFAEAEQHNAYALLIELHEHAMTFDAEGRRPDNPRHHLAELALSSAVLSWWSRWQPISIHRALIAGASLTDVAAAAGTTEAEAYERWSEWATRQEQTIINGQRGVAPAEVAAIRARIQTGSG